MNCSNGISKAVKDSRFLGGFGYTLYYNFELDEVGVVSELEEMALDNSSVAIGDVTLSANKDSGVNDLARFVAHSIPLYEKPRGEIHALRGTEIIRLAVNADIESCREAYDSGVPVADLVC